MRNCAPTDPAAVPRCTTSFIMLTMSHDSSGDITGARTGAGSHRTLPREFSTRTIEVGLDRVPSVANAEYAAIISMGYTSAAPILMEG